MAAYNFSFSSFLLLFLLSLFSTACNSTHGFIDDPLIQHRKLSGGRDDQLMSAENQFSAFKKRYGKIYTTQEEDDYRFSVFISNLHQARLNQIQDPTAVHGVTVFSDLTPSEFQRQYLGLGRQVLTPKNASGKAVKLPTDNLPHTKNWTAEGAVTHVKNQGNCDSCWAFSTIAVLEGANFLANGELVDLSAQQLLDCSKEECTRKTINNICNNGCKGGHRVLANKYIQKSDGVVKAGDYPFTGKVGECKVENKSTVASILNYHYIEPDEDQYAANLVKHGPIAVSINIKTIQTYEGGVLCPHINCSTDDNEVADHAVVLVGYHNRTTDGKFWWIVKNSFGQNWGELGFFRLCKGFLTACGKDPIATFIVANKKTAGPHH